MCRSMRKDSANLDAARHTICDAGAEGVSLSDRDANSHDERLTERGIRAEIDIEIEFRIGFLFPESIIVGGQVERHPGVRVWRQIEAARAEVDADADARRN